MHVPHGRRARVRSAGRWSRERGADGDGDSSVAARSCSRCWCTVTRRRDRPGRVLRGDRGMERAAGRPGFLGGSARPTTHSVTTPPLPTVCAWRCSGLVLCAGYLICHAIHHSGHRRESFPCRLCSLRSLRSLRGSRSLLCFMLCFLHFRHACRPLSMSLLLPPC